MMEHFKAIVSVVGAFLLLITSATAVEIPPRRLEGVAPRYDALAGQLLKEGWVYLQFKVTTEGRPEDIKVYKSYPEGVFDSEAINSLQTWKFTPKMVDGVPTEEPANRVRFIFAIDIERSVTEETVSNFRSALRAFRERNMVDAEKYVGKLRERYEKQKFNLTEVARYYQFEALLAIDKQEYVKAADWIELALQLAQYLDNKAVVDNLHTDMIVAFVGLSQFNNAVDYYDAWRKESTSEVAKAMVDGIAELKKSGYGKGRTFDIETYKERVAKSKASRPKGGKVPPQPPQEQPQN
jgi:TonB family protein